MRRHALRLILTVAVLFAGSEARAQQVHFERLDQQTLDVPAPSERIAGAAGAMRVVRSTCEMLPIAEVRRRIVNIAVQEWAFFGFAVADRSVPSTRTRGQTVPFGPGEVPNAQDRRRFGRLSREEFARLAPSIAGFWSATPDGSWMLSRQNEVADSARGSSRWRDPWSAAFVSWVMCEAGLGARSQFERSIAHRDYIDQAIRARDGKDMQSAFVAYDMGEAEINPGDLLCSGSRPDYRTIDQRRRQMGDGARTHCDIVVQVNSPQGRILTIGGNVRGTVSLKLFAAVRERGPHLHPSDDVFAHLKLRADAIETSALENSPTVHAVGCTVGFQQPVQLSAISLPLSPNLC